MLVNAKRGEWWERLMDIIRKLSTTKKMLNLTCMQIA